LLTFFPVLRSTPFVPGGPSRKKDDQKKRERGGGKKKKREQSALATLNLRALTPLPMTSPT